LGIRQRLIQPLTPEGCLGHFLLFQLYHRNVRFGHEEIFYLDSPDGRLAAISGQSGSPATFSFLKFGRAQFFVLSCRSLDCFRSTLNVNDTFAQLVLGKRR
jgi:hypothetical protein